MRLIHCLGALVTVGTACPVLAGQAVETRTQVTVLDERGTPVPLADVTVSSGEGEQALLTGDDGRVELVLPAARAGATITASASGLTSRTLTLEELSTAGNRLTLADEAASGADVIVQGRRISSAYVPNAIGKLEILTDPLARADALLAVANLPGSTNADSTADIQLRGSAAALSRAYFNDVPLYEVVRGSPVDRATRGFSVLNSSIIRDVEVYPTNPPLYLPNASGGAVRILPDDDTSETSTVYASLAGAGLTRTVPLGGDTRNQLQLYVTLTDLSPLLAVNPRLRDVTESFRSGAVGASTHYHPDAETRIGLLSVVDGERGRYPLLYLGRSGTSASDRLRLYNVLSIERAVAEFRLKVDAAYTEVRGDQLFSGYATRTRNRYGYLNADVARSLPAPFAEARIGVASETFDLRTRGLAVVTAGGFPVILPVLGDRQRAGLTAAFGYITFRPLGPVTLALGVREPLQGTPDQATSYQGTATIRLAEGQKIILGAGRYGSLAVPDAPAGDRLAPAVGEQVSLDYRVDRGPLHAALGLYAKRDTVAGRVTVIRGIDAQLSADIGDRLSLSGSFTSATPRVRDGALSYRADNYLAYLVRLSARYELSRTIAVATSLVGRSGTPFTTIGTVVSGPEGSPIVGPAASPNDRQLGDYRTVDLNVTNIMTWWPGKVKPIGFLSLTNLLDRRNQSRVDYDPSSRTETPLFYQRRAVTAGLVFQL